MEVLYILYLHFWWMFRTLLALRSQSKEWLQALYNAFISTPASERGPFFQAIAAYATISEPQVLADLFKVVLENLIKVSISVLTTPMLKNVLVASRHNSLFISSDY